MTQTNDALQLAAERGIRYATAAPGRRVAPSADAVSALSQLHERLPEAATDAREVVRLLDEIGSPATVAMTGGRYFGFVIGGVLPAALAANWLAGAWHQNAALYVMSPVAARVEEIVLAWMIDLF